MDAGIGLAVAGLAGQLFSACLEGYSLLSAAKSFGRDYEDLCWKIDTERRYLEKWADAWISGESRIDPQSPDYRFAVTTLARISGVFAEMLEYSSKYGINYHRNERKRDAFRHLVSTSLKTLSLSTQSNISTSSGLDQSSFELLTSPKLLKLDLIVPDLGDEVSRLKQSADTLQKTLPTKRKLQWSVVDKSKFEDLIVRLTEYNESLYKILPINPREETNPITFSFEIPPQLPFSRNPLFSGRNDIIDIIHSALTESPVPDSGDEAPPLTRKLVVLHGLGGIGKSSIALEYSFRYSTSYTTVFWVDATNETSFSRSARGIVEHLISTYKRRVSSYDAIASFLGLQGVINPSGQLSSDESVEPRVTRAAKEWLATQDNTQWLLIIDNYDDIDAVNVYNILPTCDTGHVIITSRRSTLHKLGRTVPVDEIDENAGIRILLKNANKPEINDGGKYDGKPRLRNELTQLVHYDVARQVTIKLGFLPLALAQAGSYIAQSQITFQKYMTLLRENFKTVATRGVQSAEERKNRTIFTTWEISFASLSPSAQELLLLCGFLANEDIPDEIFIKGGSDWLGDSLEQLFSLSLVTRKASEDSFWIHPVVHAWACERLGARAKQTKTDEAIILCGQIYTDRNEKPPNKWTFERRIWSHIESAQRRFFAIPRPSHDTIEITCEDRLWDATANLGRLYSDHGFQVQGIALLKWTLDVHEHHLGSKHPSTLSTIHALANSLRMQSEYAKALDCYQVAFNGRIQTLGESDTATLDTINGMAMVISNQGNYDKALEWYQRALHGKEKTLGKDHPSTLRTVNNMAVAFQNQRQYEKALEWYQRALDGKEKTLGKGHPSTLDTVHNMANIFRKQSEYDKALVFSQRALEGYEKTLGQDHPSALRTINNMANVFANQGEYEKALRWYQRALDCKEITLGTDNLSTLNTVRSMASAFDAQNKFDKALEWYYRALNGQVNALGFHHRSTLDTVHDIAVVFEHNGEHDKALEWYQQALDGCETTLGKHHPSTLETARDIAKLRTLNA